MRLLPAVVVVPAVVLSATVIAPSPAFADEVRGDQWMLDVLDVATTHEITKGAGTRIGLLDSGVDADHPDLKGSIEPGRDMWNDTKDGTEDALGHGTAMASLLVGHGHGKDGNNGVLGIAPDAKVVPVTIYPEDYEDDPNNQSVGAEIDRKTAEGLRWLVDEGDVDVVLMAFGGSTDKEIAKAIEYAADKKVSMFAASGYHKGDGAVGDSAHVEYPASDENVTAVAGTTRKGGHWSHSDYGPEVLISAPAEDVIAARPGGRYKTESGNSNSAAIATGVAALMDSQWPDMPWEIIQWRLTETADDVEKKGWDEKTGDGVVNPVEALNAEVEPPANPSDPEVYTKENINPEPNPRSETGSDSKDSKAEGKALDGSSGGIPAVAWWVGGGAVVVLGAAVVALVVLSKRRGRETVPRA